MKTYAIYPEVAGELALDINGDFLYKITDWSGDSIIKIRDYLVTDSLAKSLLASGLTGFSLSTIRVKNTTATSSSQWFRIQISETSPDTHIAIDHERRLIISEKFLQILTGHNFKEAKIVGLDEAPTLEDRNAEIMREMKRLSGR